MWVQTLNGELWRWEAWHLGPNLRRGDANAVVVVPVWFQGLQQVDSAEMVLASHAREDPALEGGARHHCPSQLSRTSKVAGIKRANTIASTCGDRWAGIHARYIANRWKGGHRIDIEAERIGKHDYHRCLECGKMIKRDAITLLTCDADTRVDAPRVVKSQRVAKWKAWRQELSGGITAKRKLKLKGPVSRAQQWAAVKAANKSKWESRRAAAVQAWNAAKAKLRSKGKRPRAKSSL